MSKPSTPGRTWPLVVSLGLPLTVVGAAAMAISYATLIDVARVNGLPLPELYPILVDVGTVATMIAAAQFRLRGVPGRWLAYTTFILLSGVSIVANATHAWRAADLTATNVVSSAILAATPPATLLAITHLVMMLVPDEKERAKLQARREKAQQARVSAAAVPGVRVATNEPAAPATERVRVPAGAALSAGSSVQSATVSAPLRLVAQPADTADRDTVRKQVLAFVDREGKRPTGKIVGEWLGGKTPKTGQRFLAAMESDGCFEPARQEVGAAL